MAGDAAKRVVAAQNFHIGVADSGEAHFDQRPARAEARLRFFYGDKLMISDREREHEVFFAL